MPYVNIPESQLSGAIAKLVGKVEGEVTGKVIAKANELQNKFRQKGCPAGLGRVSNQINRLSNSTQAIDRRLARFKKLPNSLKGPLDGLKAAKALILILPIPQSVPPGFGLPISITTKYADVLHLLKEFIKQIGDDVNAITHILNGPLGQLKSIQGVLSRVTNALKVCEVEKALKDKLDSGELSKQQLKELGAMNDDGDLILSNLGPKMLETPPGRSISQISLDTGLTNEQVAKKLNDQLKAGNTSGTLSTDSQQGIGGTGIGGTGIGSGVSGGGLGNNNDLATKQLQDFLTKLDGSNVSKTTKDSLKTLLDNFKDIPDNIRTGDGRLFHTGPDGTVYELKINIDINSPKIAPRRFAVAINPEGVEIYKGAKSFSSSVDVLLDEIKFRIDNQLS